MVDIPSLLGPEFYGFILPFLFSFAIVYGLLLKAKIFGEKNDRISGVLAVVIAFFVTAVGGPTLASFFTNLFGGASLFLGGILVFILLVTIVGRHDWVPKSLAVLVVVILIAIFLFLASSGTTGFIGITINSTTATLVFALIVLIAAIYYVTKGGGAEAPAPEHH